jgi:hypothetical protein
MMKEKKTNLKKLLINIKLMEPEQKSNGALMGSVIIVIILIIGGIYLWKQQGMKKAEMPENNTDTTSIETELDTMDLDSLDSGI